MNLRFCVTQLSAHRQVITSLLSDISAEQARWKPTPVDWSMLEVINHLADEEREDFRARLHATLTNADGPWPPTDPEGWITERAYNQRDLQQSLQQFLAERAESLAWLQPLDGANWDTTYQHPRRPISAGDLLVSWVAHDVLHMRQLVELRWAYLITQIGSYQIDYAGDW